MLDVYRDLIDELLGTPTEVRGMVDAAGSDVSPETARLIAEMRDRDRAVLARVQTMTREREPYLPALRLPEPADDMAWELPSLLEEMETARGDLVSLLINLSLRDWERTAIDEREDEITLADEIERHVEFDESQRGKLRALIGAA